MSLPNPGDFIDIHNHGSFSASGQFSIENLMAHESRIPENLPGIAYTFGIHPWYLTTENSKTQIDNVGRYAEHPNVIALGEAGFDRIRGPSGDLQRKIFEAQVKIAEESSKPLFIHCVRAWDELFSEYKKLRPSMQWLIHGFRGKKELAMQLISKGMFISFWIDFVLRPESAILLKGLPKNRIFLETDGADFKIGTIYEKVASDLDISVDELKSIIHSNFRDFFKI